MSDSNNLSISLVAILVAIVVLVFSLATSANPLLWAAVGAVAVFAIFYLQPLIGIFLMAFFYPFIQWQFVYGSLNIPYVDLIGVVLFGVYALKTFGAMIRGEWRFDKKDYPGLLWFAGFILIGALSLLNVEESVLASLKYLLRPIVFFYAVFVVLPIQFVKTPKVMVMLMKLLVAMGTLLSLGGLYMILISNLPFPAKRALPFGYGSFYPLGSNHNSLAEVLVGILPIALAFFWLEKDVFKRNLYLALAGFIALINFTTFSRAGWLSMIAVVFLSVYFRYRDLIHQRYLKPALSILGLSIMPISIILYFLSTTQIAQGSNLNRLKLVDIAFSLFKAHPLIGSGVGTFYRSVEQIKAYIIEYGTALDAHGVFFKVLAETGLFGIFFFSIFVAALFFKMYKQYWLLKSEECSIIAAAFITSAASVFVFELFNTSYYLGKQWIFFGLAFAALKMCGTVKLSNES